MKYKHIFLIGAICLCIYFIGFFDGLFFQIGSFSYAPKTRLFKKDNIIQYKARNRGGKAEETSNSNSSIACSKKSEKEISNDKTD